MIETFVAAEIMSKDDCDPDCPHEASLDVIVCM
jgi:hypothetical protein